jgi:hypothetical protein
LMRLVNDAGAMAQLAVRGCSGTLCLRSYHQARRGKPNADGSRAAHTM